MVNCGSIPTAIFGRVVPLPPPFELVCLCCQNLAAYEPFVDMLWSFVLMYRCVFVKEVPKGMKILE